MRRIFKRLEVYVGCFLFDRFFRLCSADTIRVGLDTAYHVQGRARWLTAIANAREVCRHPSAAEARLLGLMETVAAAHAPSVTN